ncbi:MAG: dihydropteroate synthase, partial [Pelagibacterales bacterium]|nr:dihydropteroate synthase [Pelagibacterales bacterium]
MVKTTKIVGILNITPDSFSDGGRFNSKESAIKHLENMLLNGADMIDIGAESTRPGHIKITAEEEWQRLENILPELVFIIKNFNKKFNKEVKSSIDSRNFSTAKKSYEAGIDVINDVDGLRDENMIDFIASSKATTIIMHCEPVPSVDGAIINKNVNLTSEIINWAKNKVSYLEKKGVKKSQLIFDPGIGFNKDAMQSIRILKNIDEYRSIGLPLYIGHSRKSFLKAINFREFGELNVDEKTLIISKYLIKKNIEFLRIHDVAQHKQII